MKVNGPERQRSETPLSGKNLRDGRRNWSTDIRLDCGYGLPIESR